MTKFQFLKELELALKDLPISESEDILKDYEDHFNFGFEEGKSEEAISLSLGSPHEIAKDILSNYNIKKSSLTVYENSYSNNNDVYNNYNTNNTSNIFRIILVGIALFFFNLIFVFGPAMGILGGLFGLWVAAISLLVSPLLILLNYFFSILAVSIFEVFFSIFLSGIGLFLTIGLFFLSKFLFKLILKYINFNIRLIIGGK